MLSAEGTHINSLKQDNSHIYTLISSRGMHDNRCVSGHNMTAPKSTQASMCRPWL